MPLPRAAYSALWAPRVKPVLERIPFVRRIYAGWGRAHPFDAEHGVDTSGLVSAAECAGGSGLAGRIIHYAGSQPSIVHAALSSLPDHGRYGFVDLGCGKGRPLVVASRFPFRSIAGVELAPALAQVARGNAAVTAARYPERTRIVIEVGDATQVAAVEPRIVCFMYHAFDRSLVQALIGNLERQLQGGLEHAFFVYYNPVHGDVLDESPHFARWSAEMRPYAQGELGFGPDLSDTVVVWQSVPEKYPELARARRGIVVNAAQWSALA